MKLERRELGTRTQLTTYTWAGAMDGGFKMSELNNNNNNIIIKPLPRTEYSIPETTFPTN